MRLALLLASALILPSAAPPGLLDGRWAQALRQCALESGELDGPATIRERNFDQYEAHCDWGPITSAGVGVWRAKGRCLVEGEETRGPFRFTRSGDRLDIRTPDGVATRYRSCPARR